MTTVAAPDAVRSAAAGSARTDRRDRALRLLAAAAAGVLITLAFPPYDVVVLAPIGVAVLTLALRTATVRAAALAGLVAGLAFFLPLLTWSGIVAGRDLWLILALFQASYFVPMAMAVPLLMRLRAWPVWVAALWVLQEAVRGRVPFGGFPWGRLAFGAADTPFLSYASIGGAPLMSLGVALTGALLAWAVLRLKARRGPAMAALVAAAALPAVGLLGPVTTDSDGSTTVALVQGNVPRLGLDAFAQREAVLDNHIEATRELAADVRAGTRPAPDIVLWPENASDIDPLRDTAAGDRISAAVDDIGVPVLVGAVLDAGGNDSYNAGIVWTPGEGPGEQYVKRHPVPFGEYVPFRSLIAKVYERVELAGSFLPGEHPGALDLGPVRVGDVICFEVAYDGLVRDAVTEGGRLVVVQTNNASFERSGETWQQLAMSRIRAVEHGRTVAVVATSGVSAVILPDGGVRDRSDIFTRDLLVETVPLASSHTPATSWATWLELLVVVVGAGAVIIAVVGHRRRTPEREDAV